MSTRKRIKFAVRNLTLIFILFTALTAKSAHAVSGSEACNAITSSLAQKGVLASCNYFYNADLGGYIYGMQVLSTSLDGMYTTGLMVASALGIDPQVPTSTKGIFLMNADETAKLYWNMDNARYCKQLIDNDAAFIKCLLQRGISL